MKAAFLTLAILALAASVSAECPNACSGHGACGECDYCTCQRNWQGADCSQRTCPYANAFTTTRNGDVNFDGDLEDNSYKVIDSNWCSLAISTQDVTCNAAATETLDVGDKFRIVKLDDGTHEDFEVATWTSTFSWTVTKAATIDFTSSAATHTAFFRVSKSQALPQASWEAWPQTFVSASTDDGHFYMECSNAGLCDRKVGTCQCFDGFEGLACTRNTCPNQCSGHGRCITVEQGITNEKVLLSCTVYGSVGATTLATVGTCGSKIVTNGGTITVEGYGQVAASAATTDSITVPALTRDVPYGTRVWYHAAYTLWDADKGRYCNCDGGFEGDDCSLVSCPKGDDPLTTSTSSVDQTNEIMWVTLKESSLFLPLVGEFTLTFTDMHGSKWTTDPIYTETPLGDCWSAKSAGADVLFFEDDNSAALASGDVVRVVHDITAGNVDYVTIDAASTSTDGASSSGFTAKGDLAAAITEANKVPCYRVFSAKGVEAALAALPNDVISDVTVTELKYGAPKAIATITDGAPHTLAIFDNDAGYSGNAATWGTAGSLVHVPEIDATGYVDLRTAETDLDIVNLFDGAGAGQTGTKNEIFSGNTRTFEINFASTSATIDPNTGDIPQIEVDCSEIYQAKVVQASATYAAGGNTLTLAAALTGAPAAKSTTMGITELAVGDKIIVAPGTTYQEIVTVTAHTAANVASTVEPPFKYTQSTGVAVHVISEPAGATLAAVLGATHSCSAADYLSLYSHGSTVTAGVPDVLNLDCSTANMANGCTGLGGTPNAGGISFFDSAFQAGRRVSHTTGADPKVETFYDIESIQTAGAFGSQADFTLSGNFGGTSGDVRIMGKGNTEEAECSNRGVCDKSTGLCSCFKGYYLADCSAQNALAS